MSGEGKTGRCRQGLFNSMMMAIVERVVLITIVGAIIII